MSPNNIKLKNLNMKHLFIYLISSIALSVCFTQNLEKGSIEYTLKEGGTVTLSKRVYDSLATISMTSDSTARLTTDISKIYEFYYSKRNSLYQNMTNKPVPDFKAIDTEGFKQSANAYRGRVLVLHFWSFWSNSFQDEIPELNRLIDKYSKDGLAVLSFTSLPLQSEEKQKIKENLLKFPLIEDAFMFADDFFQAKLMRPSMVIIDKNGLMRYFYDGQLIHKNRTNIEDKLTFNFEEHIQNLLK